MSCNGEEMGEYWLEVEGRAEGWRSAVQGAFWPLKDCKGACTGG